MQAPQNRDAAAHNGFHGANGSAADAMNAAAMLQHIAARVSQDGGRIAAGGFEPGSAPNGATDGWNAEPDQPAYPAQPPLQLQPHQHAPQPAPTPTPLPRLSQLPARPPRSAPDLSTLPPAIAASLAKLAKGAGAQSPGAAAASGAPDERHPFPAREDAGR